MPIGGVALTGGVGFAAGWSAFVSGWSGFVGGWSGFVGGWFGSIGVCSIVFNSHLGRGSRLPVGAGYVAGGCGQLVTWLSDIELMTAPCWLQSGGSVPPWSSTG